MINMRAIALVLSSILSFLSLTALTSCAAQTETLRMICSNEERICEQWQEDFTSKTGRPVTVLRLPTWEALGRIKKQPGNYDVWVGGPAEAYETAHQMGLLEEYRPKYAHQIPKEHQTEYWFGVYASVLAFCSNPKVLNEYGLNLPKAWADLENPKMRGLLVASSPLTSGTAFTTYWTQKTLFKSNADEKILKIYKNVGRLTHAGTAPANIVKNGEGAVAISFSPYCKRSNAQQENNLVISYPKEGTSYEIGAAALLKNAPHPGVGKNMLNYLSSPQGQQPQTAIKQLPVNQKLPNNLKEFLKTTRVKIIPANPKDATAKRQQWLPTLIRQM